MSEPLSSTPQLASTVGGQLAASLTPESLAGMDPQAIVALVLDGVNAVQSGDPLGMVRRDPASGIVYVRVDDSGVHKWRIINPADGGANAFDMRVIDYPAIYTPPVEESA